VLALLGAGHARADTLPFEGKWARQPEACEGAPSAGRGVPITITAERLIAPPFMSCEFTSVLPGGISFRIAASCDASGQRSEEFFTFAVLSGRLYWSWGGKTGVFDRCRK
jgi:hypothetical protein